MQYSSSVERERIRQEQRDADVAALQETVDSLPTGHWEKGGLIRAIEILRHEKIDSS